MSSDEGRRPIKRALLSVYDKTGLVELAQALHAAGVQIVSTGSTASTVEAAGVPVTRVEELTGFPEMPRRPGQDAAPARCTPVCSPTCGWPAHAAAARRARASSRSTCWSSNLYPFTETVASGASVDECVEQIDIGGPAMVRAAAKNHPSVAVVTAVAAYPLILDGPAATAVSR